MEDETKGQEARTMNERESVAAELRELIDSIPRKASLRGPRTPKPTKRKAHRSTVKSARKANR